MIRALSLSVCVVVGASLCGCGGGNSEIKPATTAPAIDPKVMEAKREASRKESMEKGRANSGGADATTNSGQ